MKSPSVTGYAASSDSVKGSVPSVSSSRATRIAIARESRPESRSTRSSLNGGSVLPFSSAICRTCEITVDFTDINPSLLIRGWSSGHDVADQRPEQFDAFEHLGVGNRPRQRHLGLQRAEKLLRVRDVAHTVDVRVFHFARSLTPREIGEIGHEALDEAFEEGHRHDVRNRRKAADEQTDVLQVLIDGVRV